MTNVLQHCTGRASQFLRWSANSQIRSLPQFSAKQKTRFTQRSSLELKDGTEKQQRNTGTQTVMVYQHTHTHAHTHIHTHTHKPYVFPLGGGELPECDDDESEEDRCSQEDCYNYGCDGPWPHGPFLFVENFCGIIIVDGGGMVC